MLCYNRIELNKGIDPAKRNNSKECIACHYCVFNHGFKSQHSICNACHDHLSDIAIIFVKSVDYCCIIHDISKFQTIHLS